MKDFYTYMVHKTLLKLDFWLFSEVFPSPETKLKIENENSVDPRLVYNKN